MLECPKCQHDNELGRIFCAKCGEKLEISKVGAPSGVQRRARKGKKGGGMGKDITEFFGKVVKVFFLAIASSVISLILLPPIVEQKEFAESSLESFEEKRAALENAINSEEKVTVQFSESEINAMMAKAVQGNAKTAGESKGLRLESVYVSMGDGSITTAVINKWKWFRLSAQFRVLPMEEKGKWSFKPDTAWVGRLWMPPQMTPRVMDAFKNLWSGMSQEKQWLEQLASFQVKPGVMILATKGGSEGGEGTGTQGITTEESE